MIRMLDVVALTEDVAAARLERGHVGTVVEIFNPDAYLVEFCDSDGETYAMPVLRAGQLLVLIFSPTCSPPTSNF